MENVPPMIGKLSSGFIVLLKTDQLRTKSSKSEVLVNNIVNEINQLGFWVWPIVIDVQLYILERQELYQAARALNLSAVPVVLGPQVNSNFAVNKKNQVIDELGLEVKRPHNENPRCYIPLAQLKDPNLVDSIVTPDFSNPTRIQKLKQYYHFFISKIGLESRVIWPIDFNRPLSRIPHDHLRRVLSMDPAMAALMPGLPCSIALGRSADFPFLIKGDSLLLVAPHLLFSKSALAVATRWGIECVFAKQAGQIDLQQLFYLFRYGAALLSQLALPDRSLFIGVLPQSICAQLFQGKYTNASRTSLTWMASLLESKAEINSSSIPLVDSIQPFESPLEDLLISNGDSRLRLDSKTGRNRYGVPPRPRSEAVHFSSSTASSISDYGFFYCDLMRRDLLLNVYKNTGDLQCIHSKLSDGIVTELKSLCKIEEDEADGIVAPSGTDLEVLAVLLSRAADPTIPIVNLLISPSETGRGVALAAAGRYFDSESATGTPIEKGSKIWAEANIQVIEIQIRGQDGEYLPLKDLDECFLLAGRRALESGARVLAHILLGSKTGLEGPSEEAVDALVAQAPDRVDVVVDACQMRVEFEQLGTYPRRGWMVQLSGSKSLTGPPFSGALLFPVTMRSRLKSITELMQPGIGYPEDWSLWWSERLEGSKAENLTFGAIFRWLPALLEAKLVQNVSEQLCVKIQERFQCEVNRRLSASPYLVVLSRDELSSAKFQDQFARHSIVSFEVSVRNADQGLQILDEDGCRQLFKLLNQDAHDLIPSASLKDQALLRQECHIGQPVVLGSGKKKRVVLRLVIGMRFFNIVAHNESTAVEAALESEISDLLRAIDKLEILAENWWSFCYDIA